MTLDQARYFIEAALNSSTVDVTDEQLRKALEIMLKRNETLERHLSRAYQVMEEAKSVLDALPTLEIMGELLVPRKDVIERNGIHRNTLNNKERYEPVGVEKKNADTSRDDEEYQIGQWSK